MANNLLGRGNNAGKGNNWEDVIMVQEADNVK